MTHQFKENFTPTHHVKNMWLISPPKYYN